MSSSDKKFEEFNEKNSFYSEYKGNDSIIGSTCSQSKTAPRLLEENNDEIKEKKEDQSNKDQNLLNMNLVETNNFCVKNEKQINEEENKGKNKVLEEEEKQTIMKDEKNNKNMDEVEEEEESRQETPYDIDDYKNDIDQYMETPKIRDDPEEIEEMNISQENESSNNINNGKKNDFIQNSIKSYEYDGSYDDINMESNEYVSTKQLSEMLDYPEFNDDVFTEDCFKMTENFNCNRVHLPLIRRFGEADNFVAFETTKSRTIYSIG